MSSARRRLGGAAGTVVLGLCLASCFSTVGKWTYPSGRYPTATGDRPTSQAVAVERFIDLRSVTNRSWIAWAYVPLFPLGWTHFDRPDATLPDTYTVRYEGDPCADLARSIAVELRREGIAPAAEFSPDWRPLPAGTFVLRGKLRAFYVHESRWSYGASIYAPILYCLALPQGRSANGFLVDLELVDPTDGRVLWTETVQDADDVLEGYYYGPEWYRFSWMWERRLREKLGGLAEALGAAAPPLPPELRRELTEPRGVPTCLGVDSEVPCTVQ